MAAITKHSDIGLVRLVADGVLAGSIVQDDYDIECPWHRHDMHQLQYAFEGSMELEDAKGRHLLPSSLAGWIPAGVTHRDTIRRVRSISLLLPKHAVEDPGCRIRIVRVPSLMRAMLEESVRWPIGTPADTTAIAFFDAFARLCAEWIEDEAPFALPTSADASVSAAMAYARANLPAATMIGASDAAAVSQRTLRRRFEAAVGMTWEHYLRRARLLAAVEHLTGSDRSVSSVAAAVGYESQSAFAKAFAAHFGLSPQAFRRRSGDGVRGRDGGGSCP